MSIVRAIPLHDQTLKKGTQMIPCILNFLVDESGQDLIEYALIAALVALGAVAAMRSLSNNVGKTFNSIGNSLTNAVA
jgi:pilus assembly protein Flp/PilA